MQLQRLLSKFNDLEMIYHERPKKPYKVIYKNNVVATADTFDEIEELFKMEAFWRYGEIITRKK